jgi:predicted flap endonuclease-1-like 5' DNA nuclease
MTQPIASLRSLGPKSATVLAGLGVRTLAQLKRKGAIATYVAAKRSNKSVSLNLLYGIVSAIEDCDWREVKRTRKLELVLAVEDYEQQHSGIAVKSNAKDELMQLRNIGKAMRQDFELLNIHTIKQLAKQDPDSLYKRIQQLTGTRHDPCVWDTYAAAIHQAKTGEALPWWHFTKIRKDRDAAGGNNRRPLQATPPPDVARVFDRYPARVRIKLMQLRRLIFRVAAETPGVGHLTETLKWNQPSYLTEQSRSGTLVRIDQIKGDTGKYAMYFHCQTTLLDEFRKMFADDFRFVGNRCIMFDVNQVYSETKLGQCIEMALTYHHRSYHRGNGR